MLKVFALPCSAAMVVQTWLFGAARRKTEIGCRQLRSSHSYVATDNAGGLDKVTNNKKILNLKNKRGCADA